jgi:Co/Zn/Cd efflux system component
MLQRRSMDRKNIIILKIAAILLVLVGLLAMIVAWELLLVSNIHNSTVLVLEMGGVAVCMMGYFLWRRLRVSEPKLPDFVGASDRGSRCNCLHFRK